MFDSQPASYLIYTQAILKLGARVSFTSQVVWGLAHKRSYILNVVADGFGWMKKTRFDSVYR